MHSAHAHTHTHLWWWWSCYCVYVKEIMKCEQKYDIEKRGQTHDRRGEWERMQERRISEGKLCINKGKSGSILPLETMPLELLCKLVALKTCQSCCSYHMDSTYIPIHFILNTISDNLNRISLSSSFLFSLVHHMHCWTVDIVIYWAFKYIWNNLGFTIT